MERVSDVSWVSKVQRFQQTENQGRAFQTNERTKGEIQKCKTEAGGCIEKEKKEKEDRKADPCQSIKGLNSDSLFHRQRRAI